MKTEKIIYTCDRCGKEIRQNSFGLGPHRFRKAITATRIEYERYARLDGPELAEKLELLPEEEATIILDGVCGYGSTWLGRIELCPKCSKAFKTFMKMGAKKE